MSDVSNTELGVLSKEPREANIGSHASWLGGVFESGGSIYFDVHNLTREEKKYHYAYPTLRIGNNDQRKGEMLKDFFGGSVTKTKDKNSWHWGIKGTKASKLLFAMEEYSPSRRRIIEAVDEWTNTSSPQERVEIAKQFTEGHDINPVTVEDYKRLVDDPKFVAGVIDNRGAVYHREAGFSADKSYGHVYPELRVQTQNRALLKALIERFGGTIIQIAQAGSTRKSYGQDKIVQSDILYWGLGARDLQNLLPIIRPHLIYGNIQGEQVA